MPGCDQNHPAGKRALGMPIVQWYVNGLQAVPGRDVDGRLHFGAIRQDVME
jgi:hypothetical protein